LHYQHYISNLSNQQDIGTKQGRKQHSKKTFKRTGHVDEPSPISSQILKAHAENVLKARARSHLKKKDFQPIGEAEVEKESRFVLTKRNDSVAIDSKDQPPTKKKKAGVAGSYDEGSEYNEFSDQDSKLMST